MRLHCHISAAIAIFQFLTSITLAANEPISQEEAIHFAKKVTAAVETGDLEACDGLFNIEFDMKEMMGDVEFHYQDKDAWVAQTQARLDATMPLHRQMLAQFFWKAISFKYVSTRPDAESRLVVMRSSSNKSGEINYHLLTIQRSESGDLFATDLAHVGTGSDPREILSFVSRRYAGWETADGLISKEAPDQTLLSNEKRWCMELIRCMKRGDYRGAIAARINLPRSLDDNLFINQLALSAALSLRAEGKLDRNPRLLENADKMIEHFASKAPDQPSTALKTIEYLLEKGKPDEALKQIEVLRKLVGDDPLLRISEGHALLFQDQQSKGLEMATEALKQVPYISSAHIQVAGMYASIGEYDKALDHLDTLYEKLGMVPDEDYQTTDFWKKFFESAAYQEWKSKHET